MSESIEVLERAFISEAEFAQDQLNRFSERLAQGAVFDEDKIQDLEKSLRHLHRIYKDIFSITEQHIEAETLLWGQSVYEYVKMYQEQYGKHLAQLQEEMQGLRQDMLSLRPAETGDTQSLQALIPYVQAVKDLEKNLKTVDSRAEIDDFSPKLSPYQAFLSLLSMEDLSEKVTLAGTLRTHFSAEVLLNVLTDCYTLRISPAEEKHPDITDNIHADENETTSPEALCPLQRSLKKQSANASSFKKEVFSSNANYAMLVIHAFSHLGMLTLAQMERFLALFPKLHEKGKVPNLATYLNSLESKGWLAVYVLPDETRLYAPTPYFLDTIKKDSILQTLKRAPFGLNLDLQHLAQDSRPLTELQEIYQPNDVLLDYLAQNYDACHSMELVGHYLQNSTWSSGTYTVPLRLPNDLIYCHLYGGLETNSDASVPLYLEEQDLPVLLLLPYLPEHVHCDVPCYALYEKTLYQWNVLTWEEVAFPPDTPDELDESEDPEEIEEAPTPPEDTNQTIETDPLPAEALAPVPEQAEEVSTPSPAVETNPPKADTPQAYAKGLQAQLHQENRLPSTAEVLQLLDKLLAAGKVSYDTEALEQDFTKALLLAQTLSEPLGGAVEERYAQLRLGLPFVEAQVDRSGYPLEAYFLEGEDQPVLCLSAYLYALFRPNEYDYKLKTDAELMLQDFSVHFPQYSACHELFETLVGGMEHWGISESVLFAWGNDAKQKEQRDDIQSQAHSALSDPNLKSAVNGLPKFKKLCFGEGSLLHSAMEHIVQGKRDTDSLQAVLQHFSLETNSKIHATNPKIEAFVDEQWRSASQGESTEGMPLKNPARDKAQEAIAHRLRLIATWLTCVGTALPDDMATIEQYKSSLLQALPQTIAQLEDKQPQGYRLLCQTLGYIQARLEGKPLPNPYLLCLQSPDLPLDETGSIQSDLLQSDIPYYEGWRRVLFWIAVPTRPLSQVAEDIYDSQSDAFDNIHQLKGIAEALPETEISLPDALSLQHITSSAQHQEGIWHNRLLLDTLQERLYQYERKDMLSLASTYRESFYAQENFAAWRHVLRALSEDSHDKAQEKQALWRTHLQQQVEGSSSAEVKNRLMHLEQRLSQTENLALFQAEVQGYFADNALPALPDNVYFSAFLTQYKALYEVCQENHRKARPLKTFAPEYLQNKTSASWDEKERENRRLFLHNFPSRAGYLLPEQVKILLNHLGFGAKSAKSIATTDAGAWMRVEMNPTPNHLPAFAQPFARFGTQCKTPLDVFALYGQHSAEDIVQFVQSMLPHGTAILLLAYPLDLKTRCALAERLHTLDNLTLLLLDEVLMLYLAQYTEAEHQGVLLSCTLPYTPCTVFWDDAESSLPDELFFGHRDALAYLLEQNSQTVSLYGGKGTGKTALLERAEHLGTLAAEKTYSVKINLQDCTEEALALTKTLGTLRNKTALAWTECKQVSELIAQMEAYFSRGQIASLRLFWDDADDFLQAQAPAFFEELAQTKERNAGKFHFVFASRAYILPAGRTAENWQSHCLCPLAPQEAFELLQTPLDALGFRWEDREDALGLLAQTAGYPALVHALGAGILQTVHEQYKRYYRAVDNHPPFVLDKDSLGDILRLCDWARTVEDYHKTLLPKGTVPAMLVDCLAYLTLTQRDKRYFSAEQLQEVADLYDLGAVQALSEDEILQVLDALVNRNLLHRLPEHPYYALCQTVYLDVHHWDEAVLEKELDAHKKEA